MSLPLPLPIPLSSFSSSFSSPSPLHPHLTHSRSLLLHLHEILWEIRSLYRYYHRYSFYFKSLLPPPYPSHQDMNNKSKSTHHDVPSIQRDYFTILISHQLYHLFTQYKQNYNTLYYSYLHSSSTSSSISNHINVNTSKNTLPSSLLTDISSLSLSTLHAELSSLHTYYTTHSPFPVVSSSLSSLSMSSLSQIQKVSLSPTFIPNSIKLSDVSTRIGKFSVAEGGGYYLSLDSMYLKYQYLPIINEEYYITKLSSSSASSSSTSTTPPYIYSTYISYLQNFSSHVRTLPLSIKLSSLSFYTLYKAYLSSIYSYLYQYLYRIHPFLDREKIKITIDNEGQRVWDEGKEGEDEGQSVYVGEWKREMREREEGEKREREGKVSGIQGNATIPSHSNPLFCVSCDKLFPHINVYNQHLEGKKHKAALTKQKSLAPSSSSSSSSSILSALSFLSNHITPSQSSSSSLSSSSPSTSSYVSSSLLPPLFLLEYHLSLLVSSPSLLLPLLHSTVNYNISLLSRTVEEIGEEGRRREEGMRRIEEGETKGWRGGADGGDHDHYDNNMDNDESNGDPSSTAPLLSPIYSESSHPLSHIDGRPLPTWYHRLNQLNHIFSCEICGNATYQGPKAWEEHFGGRKHTMGLRCLGVIMEGKGKEREKEGEGDVGMDNGREYWGVEKISDVLKLKKVIDERKKKRKWHGDVDEECEDGEGNVLDRKTYEELEKQGLL